jgi:tetratricopeptide (TPR) repeat protein/DNA-binding SARP family transcriptional activator
MSPDIEQLRKRLTGLVARRAGFAIALQGTAGIGKSFTVREVFNGAVCKTFGVRAIAPVAALVQVLPKPKKLAAWATRELENPEPSLEALITLLIGLAPIAIHVEDLHECTSDQTEFWQELANAITQTKGVGLIVTTRTAVPEGFETIRLEPLSGLESAQMLEAEISAKLPVEASNWIHARAAGNPLFVLEFFRFLTRRGFVWSDGKQWHWRTPERDVLPSSVEAMIERSILEACSDQSTRTALEVRAYLESKLPNVKLEPEMLAKIAGLDKTVLEMGNQKLQNNSILNQTGFAHPLFREVPIKDIPAQTRQDFARNALEVLALEDAAVFVEDAQLGREQSLELLRNAAKDSENPGPLLARAVEFADGETRTALALEAARALALFNIPLAEKMFNMVLKDNTDSDVTLEYITFLSRYNHNDARAMFDQLPEMVRATSAGLILRFGLLNFESENPTILEIWRNELGSSSDFDPDLLVHVINALHILKQIPGAIELADQVLLRSDLSPWQRARTLNRKSNALQNAGRYAEALALTEQVLAILKQYNLGGRELMLQDFANRHWMLGNHQQAIEATKEALQISLEVGNVSNQMIARSSLGTCFWEMGEYLLAEEALLEAWEFQARSPSQRSTNDTLQGLVQLYLGWFENPSAEILVRKYSKLSVEYAKTLQDPAFIATTRTFAAYVEFEYGSKERALELALEIKAMWSETDAYTDRWHSIALEGHARAELGQREEGIALLTKAVQAFEKADHPSVANGVGLELDRLTNDLESARKRLAYFEERGLMHSYNCGMRLFPELAAEANIKTIEPASTQARATDSTHLQVLGTMQITHNNNTEVIRGQKRKALLAALLEARILGRIEVKTLELLDRVYADTNDTDGLAALKQNVFKIRSSFGQDAIMTTANGYALGAISSDAEGFLKQTDTQLWRGAYLQDALLEANDVVSEILTQALQKTANSLLESDPTETARSGRILLETDPYNLPALQLTCQALRALKNHRSLTRTYSESREKLLEVGESLPVRWQDFLRGPLISPEN